MFVSHIYAYDIEVKNEDGVTIYYNYIKDQTELSVTDKTGWGDYSGDVNIPSTVTYMDKTLYVTEIGYNAFKDCVELTSVTIPNSVTVISAKAFYGCKKLTNITIPNSVEKIMDSAFYGSGLTSIAVPDNVNRTGSKLFFGCTNIISATVGNGVKEITLWFFGNCYELSSVILGNNVNKIWNCAFQDCSKLETIILHTNIPPVLEDIAFPTSVYKNATLYVPEGSVDAYKNKDNWKKFYNIVEGVPAYITNPSAKDNVEENYFSIDGIRHNKPIKGLNIIKKGSKSTKVLIK